MYDVSASYFISMWWCVVFRIHLARLTKSSLEMLCISGRRRRLTSNAKPFNDLVQYTNTYNMYVIQPYLVSNTDHRLCDYWLVSVIINTHLICSLWAAEFISGFVFVSSCLGKTLSRPSQRHTKDTFNICADNSIKHSRVERVCVWLCERVYLSRDDLIVRT